MRYGAFALPLVLAGTAACEPPTKSFDLLVALPTAHAWSRGDLLLVSDAFRPPTQLPTVRVGAGALPVRRVDDSTVAATLPDTAGAVALHVHHDGTSTPVGPVTVAGFRDRADGPLLSGSLVPWPRENPTGVIGAGDSGAVLVDLRFNLVVRQFPESLHSPACAWGVGTSVLTGHVVLYGRAPGGGCRSAVSYHVGTTVTAGDTLVAFPGTWVLGEVGRRRSMASSDSWLYLRNCEPTPCLIRDVFGGGGVTGATVSPRGDRVALDNGGGYPPIVIDPSTLTAAFTLPRLRYANGAAFSTAGDTLWVAGPDSQWARHVVVALDAATGALLTEAVLDSVIPFPGTVRAVAADPDGPWLYVAVSSTAPTLASKHTLLVLDARTLAVRGVLSAPPVDALALEFERIVPMPGGRVIYVVSTAQGYDLRGWRARIHRYDRLPS